MPNEYHVIYLDESSELTQEQLDELVERLRRTDKIIRLSSVLFGEEV